MTENTVNLGIAILDEIRLDYGQESQVYSECCNLFQDLYNNDYLDGFHNYKRVLYNPVSKTHEMEK